MCLGMPGQIVAVQDELATVDFWGTQKCVRLDALKGQVVIGDYILDHAGHAVRVIPIEDVPDTLALYEVLLSEAGEDPIVRDVSAELCSELEPVLS